MLLALPWKLTSVACEHPLVTVSHESPAIRHPPLPRASACTGSISSKQRWGSPWRLWGVHCSQCGSLSAGTGREGRSWVRASSESPSTSAQSRGTGSAPSLDPPDSCSHMSSKFATVKSSSSERPTLAPGEASSCSACSWSSAWPSAWGRTRLLGEAAHPALVPVPSGSAVAVPERTGCEGSLVSSWHCSVS